MYRTFDRTNRIPNFRKTEENDALDIGWGEGTLIDQRPWYAEVWAQDQATFVTFFFSSEGIETISNDMIKTILKASSLVTFRGSKEYVGIRRFNDDSGGEFWSATVVIGDEDEMFADTYFTMRRYEGKNSTSTI